MKKFLFILFIIAQLAQLSAHADGPPPRRVPVPPQLIITPSKRLGAPPVTATIKWKIGHPADLDYLEYSTQPSGGVWNTVERPYLEVDGYYVVPIFLNDSPKNRMYYRVVRWNPF